MILLVLLLSFNASYSSPCSEITKQIKIKIGLEQTSYATYLKNLAPDYLDYEAQAYMEAIQHSNGYLAGLTPKETFEKITDLFKDYERLDQVYRNYYCVKIIIKTLGYVPVKYQTAYEFLQILEEYDRRDVIFLPEVD